MAVKPLRRIAAPVAASLFDQISARLIQSLSRWRSDLDALERDHPELILWDGGNVLAVEPRGDIKLLYGFENERAFVDRFPGMLEKMLPRIRKLAGESMTLRFSYSPARPIVEPMLRRLWFSPRRDWIEFTLSRDAKLAAAPAPKGIRFREGTPDDAAEISRVDREAFPNTPIEPDVMRRRLESGDEHLLVAMAGKEIAGFVLSTQRDPGYGYINILAITEAHRGKGVGAALTTRAAKRLFANGAQDVALTTHDNNSNAIRLYVRLGFKQTNAGRDYTRPTNPKAIKEMQIAGTGTLIRFGGWR